MMICSKVWNDRLTAARPNRCRMGTAAQAREQRLRGKRNRATCLTEFKLERYFAEYEFTTKYLMCCSDAEPLRMSELLELADAYSLERWKSLSLGYTESAGLPALREEVAALYPGVEPEDVTICAPSEGIYLAMLALLSPGDCVVCMRPGYQSLYEIASAHGCTVRFWEPEPRPQGAAAGEPLPGGWCGQLQFDVDRLQALMAEQPVKLVVANLPHNPTGDLLTASQLQRVVELCRSLGASLFCDEMYRGLEVEEHLQLPSAVQLYDGAAALCGMSKALSLPGLRIGWLVSRNSEVTRRVQVLKDYTTICSSAPSEVLALMGLRARHSILHRNKSIIRSNLAVLQQFFQPRKHLFEWHPPRAGTIAFPRLLANQPVDSFCRALVEGQGVLLLPATVYSHQPSIENGHFRIGVGRRDLPDCVEQLAAFVDTHRWGL